MAGVSEPASALTEQRRRGPGRRFPPGRSGNPTGLPKEIAPLVAEARRLALSHAPRAIATLAELLDNEDPRVRAVAAQALLDRGGLRPYALEPERVEVTAAPIDVDALRAHLAARVAGLASQPHEQAVGMPPPAPASVPSGGSALARDDADLALKGRPGDAVG